MAEEQNEQEQPQQPEKVGKWRRRIGISLIAIALVLLALSLAERSSSKSINERIAEIQAANKIPDEQNAALIYNQLLQDANATGFPSALMSNKAFSQALHRPWLATDYPELKNWLTDHQQLINKLLEASQITQCRFPLGINDPQMQARLSYLAVMRQWAQMLVCAANNDQAVGRHDAAMQKYLCVIRMGEHLHRQPVLVDELVGIAVDALAVMSIKRFVLQALPTKQHLEALEETLPHSKQKWLEQFENARELENLYQRSQLGFISYSLTEWWFGIPNEKAFEHAKVLLLRLLSDEHGTRILIALRHYKDENGRWPENIDAVKSLLPKDILIDPANDGSFVYKVTGDSFTLYSKGPNNLDDDGQRNDGKDDWPIWPTK